jgi:DNA-binding response OmpR family regulator
MLPDLDGFDVVEKLRLRGQDTLVLMLTARDCLRT